MCFQLEKKRLKDRRQPKIIDPKHEYLRTIRTHRKKVVFTDIETEESTTYDSIYKAVKATGYVGRYMARLCANVRQKRKYRIAVE